MRLYESLFAGKADEALIAFSILTEFPSTNIADWAIYESPVEVHTAKLYNLIANSFSFAVQESVSEEVTASNEDFYIMGSIRFERMDGAGTTVSGFTVRRIKPLCQLPKHREPADFSLSTSNCWFFCT